MKKPNPSNSLLSLGCAVVVLAPLLIWKSITNGVDEFYSPGYITYSPEQAKERNVFVSQLKLQSPILYVEDAEYPIKAAWIERSTRVKYSFFFFRRTIPTGYRLMIDVSPRMWGGEARHLICNGSIRAGGTTRGTIWFTQIEEPLPATLDCAGKE